MYLLNLNCTLGIDIFQEAIYRFLLCENSAFFILNIYLKTFLKKEKKTFYLQGNSLIFSFILKGSKQIEQTSLSSLFKKNCI